jgi:ketosteroid isomerase-like protein
VSRDVDYPMIHYTDTMSPTLARILGSPRRAGLAVLLFVAACGGAGATRLTPEQTAKVRAEIEQTLRDAYDLSKPDVAERMLGLYPPTGAVVSAAGGTVISSRDSLAAGIRYFWNNVGGNMRSPQWVWERFYIDVLSPTAAVVTATYRIPHRDPQNRPHEIAGAMTEAFEKRGGRWVVVQEHLSDRPTSVDSSATMPTHDHH